MTDKLVQGKVIFFGILMALVFLGTYFFSYISLSYLWLKKIFSSEIEVLDTLNIYMHQGIVLFLLVLIYFVVSIYFKGKIFSKGNFKIVLLFFFLFQLILLLNFPFLSHDVLYYVGTASITTDFYENPYVFSIDQAGLSSSSYIPWSHVELTYGPLWALISSFLKIFSSNFVISIFIFKFVIILFNTASLFILYKIFELKKPELKEYAVLLYAWNPLILLEAASSGHNEIIIMFFLLLSVYFIIRKKYIFAFIVLFLSFLIKYTLIILLPLFIIYIWKNIPEFREKINTIIKIIIFSLLILLITFIPFIDSNFFIGLEKHNKFFSSDMWRGGSLGMIAVLPQIIYGYVDGNSLDQIKIGITKSNIVILASVLIIFYYFILFKKYLKFEKLLVLILVVYGIYLLASPTVVHAWYYVPVIPISIMLFLIYQKRLYYLIPILTMMGLSIYYLMNVKVTLIALCGLIFITFLLKKNIININIDKNKVNSV